MASRMWTSITRASAAWLAAIVLSSGCSPGGYGGGGVQAGPEIVEGGVIFRLHDADAETVFLVGDFNQWTPGADPLVDENGDGEWTLYFPLNSGVYEYKFIIDNKLWIADPKNPVSVPDGFDGRNSVVSVPPKS